MNLYYYIRYILLLVLCVACNSGWTNAKDFESHFSLAPYARSSIIRDVKWNRSSITTGAAGSDLWPLTWASDNHLYSSWGDGGGFKGSNSDGRVSIGVARIKGEAYGWSGINIWGGKNPISMQTPITGKCNGGIISIESDLLIFVEEQGKWTRCRLFKSSDNGKSWANLGWIFEEPNALFASPALVQFGKDYSGARDDYVYGYGEDRINKDALFLFRVNKKLLHEREKYSFFSGKDGTGKPIWSANIADAVEVFKDKNGVGWGVNCSYHRATERYLLTVRHNEKGGWGIFEAPEPWGPWNTVAYYENWIDSIEKFTFVFNQKWTYDEGRTVWMVFSGREKYDSFNVIEAGFILNNGNFLKQ